MTLTSHCALESDVCCQDSRVAPHVDAEQGSVYVVSGKGPAPPLGEDADQVWPCQPSPYVSWISSVHGPHGNECTWL